MAIEISIYPCQRLILAYTTYKFHNNRTIRSQWNHYRLILGKVYQLDSGVELLEIPGGRLVGAMDFRYEIPRLESCPRLRYFSAGLEFESGAHYFHSMRHYIIYVCILLYISCLLYTSDAADE